MAIKGLSNESIKQLTTNNNSLTPELNYYGTKTKIKFTGSSLKQPSHTITYKKLVSIYVVYELAASSSHIRDPTLKFVYLVRLLQLEMQTLKNTNILVMVLDLIEDQVFHFLVVGLVKMC